MDSILFVLIALPLVLLLVGICLAIWVYRDAKRYREAGVEILAPWAWTLLVLFFGAVAFPVYFVMKLVKYDPQKKAITITPTAPPQLLSRKRKFLVILVIAVFAVLAIRGAVERKKAEIGVRQAIERDIEKTLEKKEPEKPTEVNVAFAYILEYSSDCFWDVDPETGQRLHQRKTPVPNCEIWPRVTGNTKLERWNELAEKLKSRQIGIGERRLPGAKEDIPFPSQNENGLDMDYVWLSNTISPFSPAFYIYWTDPQTGERWQLESTGSVRKVRP